MTDPLASAVSACLTAHGPSCHGPPFQKVGHSRYDLVRAWEGNYVFEGYAVQSNADGAVGIATIICVLLYQ
ncbi:hypothetical protein MPLSOD_10125 [Mesorhizobium sp. SOD10]|nr:hypothetical protein MPLSOD_10125 [Mesorhizobium sp. SOD10]